MLSSCSFLHISVHHIALGNIGWVEKRLLRDTMMCRWTSKPLDLDLPWGWAAD